VRVVCCLKFATESPEKKTQCFLLFLCFFFLRDSDREDDRERDFFFDFVRSSDLSSFSLLSLRLLGLLGSGSWVSFSAS